MKERVSIVLLLVAATLITAHVSADTLPLLDQFTFLPLVLGGTAGVVTPTPTLLPTITPTPTPTLKPTLTPIITVTPTIAPVMTPTPDDYTPEPPGTFTPTPTLPPTWTPTPTPEPSPLLNGDFEQAWGFWTEEFDPSPSVHPMPFIVMTYMQLWGIPYLEGYGSWLAWLGNADAPGPSTDTITAIEQPVTIPTGGTLHLPVSLCFDFQTFSEAHWGNGGDSARLLLDSTVLATWEIESSADNGTWHERCINLEAWKGQTVLLRFEMSNNFIWRGDFYLDNVRFQN